MPRPTDSPARAPSVFAAIGSGLLPVVSVRQKPGTASVPARRVEWRPEARKCDPEGSGRARRDPFRIHAEPPRVVAGRLIHAGRSGPSASYAPLELPRSAKGSTPRPGTRRNRRGPRAGPSCRCTRPRAGRTDRPRRRTPGECPMATSTQSMFGRYRGGSTCHKGTRGRSSLPVKWPRTRAVSSIRRPGTERTLGC
jgi:hypothetical protein